MAIYHLAAKAVSRSGGRSATAAAAYRAGEYIEDERTGQQHDYTRKRGVEHTEIVVPDGQPGPDRVTLWNLAEMAERRKDACVAREIEIALPSEITAEQRHALAVGLARTLATERGCAVDVCIHAPSKNGDKRNHHAHLLMTTRTVQRLESDVIVLGAKSEQERAGRDRKADLAVIRERWAAMCNAALARVGQTARVDHRTLEAQGVRREPTRHLGPAAAGYERRTGQPSKKRLTWKVEADASARLAAAAARSPEIEGLNAQILALETDLAAARAERDQRQAAQYAQQIAMGLSPEARRAILSAGRVDVLDQGGTHWLVVREDGVLRAVARGRAEDRHLAERVTAALPAAVLEVERAAQQAQHNEPPHAAPNARQDREQPPSAVRWESRREPPPTPAELADAQAALVEYARRHRISTDTLDNIRTATNGLRAEWMAAGTGTQRQYMALRKIRRAAEGAARQRLRRAGNEGNGIGGAQCMRGYRSAEVTAAHELGLRYDWDATARVRRYRDRAGTELFTATRRAITMTAHDATAETAALRIAAAKWSGRASIQGSAEFRERSARAATRMGIQVEDADLQAAVRDERKRMARGDPDPPERARLQSEAKRQGEHEDEAEDEQDQDLG